MKKNLHDVKKFFCASLFYRDAPDNLAFVIGLSPYLVEKAIDELAEEEERSLRNDFDYTDEEADRLLDDLCWSGVHPLTREELIGILRSPEYRWRIREIVEDLREEKVCIL